MQRATPTHSLLALAIAASFALPAYADPALDAEPRKERARDRLRDDKRDAEHERKLEKVEVEGQAFPFRPVDTTTEN